MYKLTKMSGQPARTKENIETQIAQIQQLRAERPNDDNEDIQKENDRIGLGNVGGMFNSDIYGATGKKNLEGQHDTIGGNEEDEDDEDGVSPNRGYQRLHTLPDELFSYIMVKVGLKSLDDLHSCRQVCRTWNELILSLVWGSEGSKGIMKERIERSWGHGVLPSNEEISHAKWLGDGCLFVKFINVTFL